MINIQYSTKEVLNDIGWWGTPIAAGNITEHSYWTDFTLFDRINQKINNFRFLFLKP
jgi:hypothetical protein